jgi:hypothetical protein
MSPVYPVNHVPGRSESSASPQNIAAVRRRMRTRFEQAVRRSAQVWIEAFRPIIFVRHRTRREHSARTGTRADRPLRARIKMQKLWLALLYRPLR